MIDKKLGGGRTIQMLELFGGIGAPHAAMNRLGIPVKTIDYVEIDKKAVASYNSMFRPEYKTQDVTDWNLQPDILVHGSPCQDISVAGYRKGADENSDTRSSLMWETVKIIQSFGQWRPKIVIWENVKNVRSKLMRHNHERYMSELKKLGYVSSFAILNALDFGLPQKRERVFTVSILGDRVFNFDNLQKSKAAPLSDYLTDTYKPWHIVTQKSVLKGIDVNHNISLKRTNILNDYCYTIMTKQDRCPAQVVKIGEDKYRYLTELECWRLMGFNDAEFYAAEKACPREGGRNNTLYKQAGNSMPVNVLVAIFKAIFDGGYL